MLTIVVVAWAGFAAAADHVVAGTQLKLQRTSGDGTLSLQLKDVTAIPAPGSADDPSVAGLTITLFGQASGEKVTLVAPAGLGKPGWKVRAAPKVTYTYANAKVASGSTTLQSATLRAGPGLRVRARTAGLSLSPPTGAVAVRVEWGSERVCALFDGDAVRADAPGRFVARAADAPPFANCDDSTLAGPGRGCGLDGASCSGTCPDDAVCGGNPLIGCTCVSPHQPCGGSAPVCNGECPTGEECAETAGGPWPSCGCLPAGSSACGGAHPSCGDGDCPAGTSCYANSFVLPGGAPSIDYCACSASPPTDACGGDCPEGWTCIGPRPGIPAMCLPPFCDGGAPAPACGGTCSDPSATCTSMLGNCFCV